MHSFEEARVVKLTVNGISKLKRKTIPRTVPRNAENERFVEFVKERFPEFDSDFFFKEVSPEASASKVLDNKIYKGAEVDTIYNAVEELKVEADITLKDFKEKEKYKPGTNNYELETVMTNMKEGR